MQQLSGLGVCVDSNVRLQPEQEQDLIELVMEQIKRRQLGGAFAVVGQQEADYYLRAQKLSSALVNYAKSQNSEVEIDGKLSSLWLKCNARCSSSKYIPSINKASRSKPKRSKPRDL